MRLVAEVPGRRASGAVVLIMCGVLAASCGGSSGTPQAQSASGAGATATTSGATLCESVATFEQSVGALSPSLSPADRLAEIRRLSNELSARERAATPPELVDAFATITTVDVTAVSGPTSTSGDAYRTASTEIAHYIQTNCGITPTSASSAN